MSLNNAATCEYFDAHKGMLNGIVQGVSTVVSEGADVIVEQNGPADQAHLLRTPYVFSPDLVTDTYGSELPEDVAALLGDALQERVNLDNFFEVNTAESTFRFLQAIATMHALGQNKVSGDGSVEDLMLGYETGRREVAFRQHLTLAANRLISLDVFDSAGTFLVVKNHGLATAELSVQTLGDSISSVAYSWKPTEDAQLIRWVKMIGSEQFAQLLPACAGLFEDESELYEALAKVQTHFIGSALEEEIEPVLDEVRIRALAAKEAHALNGEFITDLPSADELAATVSELAEL